MNPWKSGAFPAVLIVATACVVAGCSTSPRRTEAERAADADTAARVEAALAADRYLFARHIDVWVESGVVHLGGYVWSTDDYFLARRDAAAVPGVRVVSTEMELMRGGGRK